MVPTFSTYISHRYTISIYMVGIISNYRVFTQP
ncbi:MAG: hypothetical protein, partial [Olavius algarvensis Gamma 3 endosymbiont]